LGAVISVAAWDFAAGLMLRWPILGLVISGLLGLFVLILLIMACAMRHLAHWKTTAYLRPWLLPRV
jgi:putative membrane protein